MKLKDKLSKFLYRLILFALFFPALFYFSLAVDTYLKIEKADNSEKQYIT